MRVLDQISGDLIHQPHVSLQEQIPSNSDVFLAVMS